MKFIKFLPLIFLILVLIFSCQKEPNFNNTISSEGILTERSESDSCNSYPLPSSDSAYFSTCESGDFSIVNGVLKFDDKEEFFKTLYFLECATGSQIEAWRNSFSLVTAQKKYDEILGNAECRNDTISYDSIISIIMEDEKYLTVHYDESKPVNFSPLYKTYPEFRNLDGYFMIGNQIEAEVLDGTRVSILDGDWDKLDSTLNNPDFPSTAVTYYGGPYVVIIREEGPWRPSTADCCPRNSFWENVYDNGDKRIRGNFIWSDGSIWTYQSNTNEWFVDPVLTVSVPAVSQKKGFLGIWTRHKRHWNFNTRVKYYFPSNQHIDRSRTGYGVVNDEYTSGINDKPITFRLRDTYGPYTSIPDPFLCVYIFEHDWEISEQLNGTLDATLTAECDNSPATPCEECPDTSTYPGYYYDGANCAAGFCAPSGTNAFVYNGAFYSTPLSGNVCPTGTFDGANCYIAAIPIGFSGFVWNNCYYTHPECP